MAKLHVNTSKRDQEFFLKTLSTISEKVKIWVHCFKAQKNFNQDDEKNMTYLNTQTQNWPII